MPWDKHLEGVRPEVRHLIDRMVNGESLVDAVLPSGDKVKVSEGSESWNATREAERLDDPAIAEELRPLLAARPPARVHGAACFIIARIGRNAASTRCAEILIDHLRTATRTSDLTDALNFLSDVPRPASLDIGPLLALLKHPKTQVVQSTLYALRNADHPEIEDAVIALSETTEDVYLREPANQILADIGTPKAYPILEAGLASRKRDTKQSARFAIDAIRARHPDTA